MILLFTLEYVRMNSIVKAIETKYIKSILLGVFKKTVGNKKKSFVFT